VMAKHDLTLSLTSRALPGFAASNGRALAGLGRAVFACAAALLALLFVAPQEAFAQAQTNLEQVVKVPKIGKAEPMLLQADEMIYDNENGKITARGNVEIYYGNYTLLADRVVYNRNLNTLTAEGNVRIKDPDGAVITADHLTLTDDFRDGFIDALKLVTKDDTRIVASSATREAGNVTVFQKGWFTPCKVCEEDPTKPPTWRIRATKIIHKTDQATITFKNAFFDFFGVPLIYVPYFQMADPTVKRKSGFLLPSYSHSNELGSTLQIPYYFALADNYDFTFAPMFTENAGQLLDGRWRHRLSNGGYSVDLAGVFDPPGDADGSSATSKAEDFRGSIDTEGKFALDPYYAWGWDVIADTDKTFRRFYNLDSRLETERVSQIYLEGLHDRNYLSTRFYNTESLLQTNDPSTDTWVLPIVDYDYIVNKPIIGGELSFNANTMFLTSQPGLTFNQDADNFDETQAGPDSARLIVEANWRRQMIDGIGEVYTPFAELRGDAYNISNANDSDVTTLDNGVIEGPSDGALVRGNAVAGMEYRYPFIARTGIVSHVFEPIGQIIVRPNTVGDQQDIPNEDALSLVFDDTLLFDIDKFSGYDRIETGTRANVGVRYTAQLPTGSYARAVFGESYQLAGQNAFDTDFYRESGLATSSSDYVAGVYLQALSFLSLSAQSRFNQETFARERTDLGSTASYGPALVSVNYAEVNNDPSLFTTTGTTTTAAASTTDREEIVTSGALALTTDWSLLGNLRYDIAGNQTITDGLGLSYHDDCFLFSVTYQRSFIRDQDIEPDQRFLVNFMLKYLGSYQFATDPLNSYGTDTALNP
jgi:LPS-assembly protein